MLKFIYEFRRAWKLAKIPGLLSAAILLNKAIINGRVSAYTDIVFNDGNMTRIHYTLQKKEALTTTGKVVKYDNL